MNNDDDIDKGSGDRDRVRVQDRVLTILLAIKELHMRRGSTSERGLRGVVVNALKRTRPLRLSTDPLGKRRGKRRQRSKGKGIENFKKRRQKQEGNKGTFHNFPPIYPFYADGTTPIVTQ